MSSQDHGIGTNMSMLTVVSVPALLVALLSLWALINEFAGKSLSVFFLNLSLCGQALPLLFSWLAIVILFLLACAWALLRQRIGDRQSLFPPTTLETMAAVILTATVLAISSATLPANVIKDHLLNVMLPLASIAVLWRASSGCLTLSHPLLLATGTLACWWLSSVFIFSDDRIRSATLLAQFLAYAVWGLLLYALFANRNCRENLLRLLFLLVSCVSGYALLQVAGFDPAPWGRTFSLPELGIASRAISTFGNPNFLGLFIAIIFPFCLRQGFTATTRKQLAYAAMLIAFSASALVLTFSRASYLGALVSTGVLLYGLPQRHQRIMLATTLLIIAICSSPWTLPRLLTARGMTGDDQVRLQIWHAAMQMVATRPLTGYGLGTFNQSSAVFFANDFHRIHPIPQYIIEHAHSEWFEWWAETGSFGLLAIIFLLVFTARRLWQRAQQADPSFWSLSALAALASGCTHAFFETKLRYPSSAIPLIFLLTAAFAPAECRLALPRPRRWLSFIGTSAAIIIICQSLVSTRANLASKDSLDAQFQNDLTRTLAANRQVLLLDPGNLAANHRALLFAPATTAGAGYTGLKLFPALFNYQDAALLLSDPRCPLLSVQQKLSCLDHYHALHPLDARVPIARASLFLADSRPLIALDICNSIPAADYSEQYYALLRQSATAMPWTEQHLPPAIQQHQEIFSPQQGKRLEALLARGEFTVILAQLDRHFRRATMQQTFPPPLRQFIEKFANTLLAFPATGKSCIIPLGDLLMRMGQYAQANIIYRQAAARLGVSPAIIAERCARLGLTANDRESLNFAVAWYTSPAGNPLVARYLTGRLAEMSQQPARAAENYRLVLHDSPLHLGAVAGLLRTGTIPPAIADQQLLLSARHLLGAAVTAIIDTNPVWAVSPPVYEYNPDNIGLDKVWYATSLLAAPPPGNWSGQTAGGGFPASVTNVAGATSRITDQVASLLADPPSPTTADIVRWQPAAPAAQYLPANAWSFPPGPQPAPAIISVTARDPQLLQVINQRIMRFARTDSPDAAKLFSAVFVPPNGAEETEPEFWQNYYRAVSATLNLGFAQRFDEMRLLLAPDTSSRMAGLFLSHIVGLGPLLGAEYHSRNLQLLDAAARNPYIHIPGYAWLRPTALYGQPESYYSRWQTSPVYNRPVFKTALAQASVPQDTAAEFSSTPAPPTDPHRVWSIARKRLAQGLPVTEELHALRNSGASGWHQLLATLAGPQPADYWELEDGSVVIPPDAGTLVIYGGETTVVTFNYIPVRAAASQHFVLLGQSPAYELQATAAIDRPLVPGKLYFLEFSFAPYLTTRISRGTFRLESWIHIPQDLRPYPLLPIRKHNNPARRYAVLPATWANGHSSHTRYYRSPLTATAAAFPRNAI